MTFRPRHSLALLAAMAPGTGAAMLAPAPSYATGTPLPTHVYAPYFETWTTDSITTVAQESGARYFTLAFIEVPTKGSCTPVWNGTASQTMESGRYLSDIASLRALGGDVIPSFGGVSADNGGTEPADSCKDGTQNPPASASGITTHDV